MALKLNPEFFFMDMQVMPKTEIASILALNMSVQAFMTAPLAKKAGQSVSSRNTMLALGFVVMIAANAAFGLPFFGHRWGETFKSR